MELQYRRPDGSFVALINGYPYHVTESDPLFAQATAKAAEREEPLPLEPPAPPAPDFIVPITDRQFAQQLAVDGVITEAEALAWAARGDLPGALETAIGQLEESERFSARMLLSAAVTYHRGHQLVERLGVLLGYEPAQIDDLWRAASAL